LVNVHGKAAQDVICHGGNKHNREDILEALEVRREEEGEPRTVWDTTYSLCMSFSSIYPSTLWWWWWWWWLW